LYVGCIPIDSLSISTNVDPSSTIAYTVVTGECFTQCHSQDGVCEADAWTYRKSFNCLGAQIGGDEYMSLGTIPAVLGDCGDDSLCGQIGVYCAGASYSITDVRTPEQVAGGCCPGALM
jgi:hypothetical protein